MAVELAVKKLDMVPVGCGLSVAVASALRIVVESGFDAAALQSLVQVFPSEINKFVGAPD